MECYKIENLTFKYPSGTENALSDISLCVNQGEFILLCGKSGCGKTTLLCLLKSVLAPHGEMNGNIYFYEESLDKVAQDIQAEKIGFVMQNPENQAVTDKVWHELAFGLENMGLPNPEIRARVSEMAEFFGITDWFYKDVSELSGGQLQILNLASVMVMEPDVLILDEPTSQLDPIASGEFLKAVGKVNREIGTTIILSEHRLEDSFALADRVVVMDSGKVIADDTPQKVGMQLKAMNHEMVSALPTPMIVADVLTVRDGRIWLEDYFKTCKPCKIEPKTTTVKTDVCAELKDVWFRYDKKSTDVLKGLSLKINRGEFYAIVGGNGTGKTTALSVISGINKPYRGKRKINGKVSVLPQNPQMLFTENTVRADLLIMNPDDSELSAIINDCGISHLLDRHPYDLSGGEIQRCALAKVLLTTPDILLLDEPTKGLDAHFKMKFADIINSLTQKGTTVVTVSHDIEFCARYADRCSMFFDGTITAQSTPYELFGKNRFYTTAAARMARRTLPGAVLAEDIIRACKGEQNE